MSKEGAGSKVGLGVGSLFFFFLTEVQLIYNVVLILLYSKVIWGLWFYSRLESPMSSLNKSQYFLSSYFAPVPA